MLTVFMRLLKELDNSNLAESYKYFGPTGL